MLKRCFDIFASLVGLIILFPLFLLLIVWIKIDSKGPAFYKQNRVGKNNKDFLLYKFRTMKPNSDKGSLITIGGRDPRITKSGYLLRKLKIDELPQLINVLNGDMSLVGPRPEVRRYVDLYTSEQMKVLRIRPGITDLASIKYKDENELLGKAEDPETYYTQIIMQDKLRYNLLYIDQQSFLIDLKLIFLTVIAIFKKK